MVVPRGWCQVSGVFFDGCWIVGGTLAGIVLWKACDWSWFTVTKKQPPQVRIPDEAQIFRSAKSIVRLEERRIRASAQKGNYD